MKRLLFVPLLFALFSCEQGPKPCWYYSGCTTGCMEKINDKYYCTHCCIVASQRSDGWEHLDKESMNSPVDISAEELKGLQQMH